MVTFLWRYQEQFAAPESTSFADVPQEAWFAGALDWVAFTGVTTGTTPTTFSPLRDVSRAQMAAFLWRLAGRPAVEPAGSPFDDVPSDAWFEGPVTWLKGSGVTTGVSPRSFAPSRSVSRGQMVAFLWRLAGQPAADQPGVNRLGDAVETRRGTAVVAADVAGQRPTLTFAGDPEVADGDLVAVSPSDALPTGMWGRVIDVAHTDGQTTVRLERVPLTAVMPEISVDATGVPAADGWDLEPQALRLPLWRPDCAADVSSVELPRVRIEPRMPHLQLEAGWRGISRFELSQNTVVELSGSLRAGPGVECEWELSGPEVPLATLPVGAFPVFVTVGIDGELTIGSSTGVDVSIGDRHEINAAFGYADGEWGDRTTHHRDGPQLDAGEVLVSGDATLFAGIELDAEAAGTLGAYINAGPTFEASLQACVDPEPWWSLRSAVRTAAGVEASLFGLWEDDWDLAQVDLFATDHQASGVWPWPAICGNADPQPPSPPPGAGLTLNAGGIGDREFGAAFEAVFDTASQVLGTPSFDSGRQPDGYYGVCGSEVRVLGWGGSGAGGPFDDYWLELAFFDRDGQWELASWQVEAGLPDEVRTAVRLGATETELREQWGDHLNVWWDGAMEAPFFSVDTPQGTVSGYFDGEGGPAWLVHGGLWCGE